MKEKSDSVCDVKCGLPESEAELRKLLTPEQYEIVVRNGTERPFENAFWNHHEAGLYVDVVSGEPLFASFDKFDSGTGWPSFTRPINAEVLRDIEDLSHGLTRTEVRSRKSNSHLGHVFDDGPDPTGLRYCINSAALKFIPLNQLKEAGYGDYLSLFEEQNQSI
ncbi:MAG: peptide-methionine (R)-S-oxide reductase MsrB [Pseudobdellovibrionaceae bacterium]